MVRLGCHAYKFTWLPYPQSKNTIATSTEDIAAEINPPDYPRRKGVNIPPPCAKLTLGFEFSRKTAKGLNNRNIPDQVRCHGHKICTSLLQKTNPKQLYYMKCICNKKKYLDFSGDKR